jgi:hypothetical protein
MPQVPVYSGPQVRTAPLQPVLQNTPDVSSGGRAIAQGLGAVAEAADRIDLRAAETKANEVDTQLTRAWNRWEDDNRGKFTNQNAEGYKAAVEAWWRDAAKTYGQGLDMRAQSMVSRTLSRRETVALDQAGKYESAEKEKYADSNTNAAINTATVSALRTGDYAGESQRIRDLVEEQGLRKRWNKDQRDLERNARLGMFNMAVIAQLAERNAAEAQTYLTGAIERGEIRPDQQPRLEQVIKAEGDNQFARQESVRLMALPPEQRNAELAKITDPVRLEKTQIAMKAAISMQREAQREVEERMSDQAWQMFSRGERIPEAILSGMNGRERAQLTEAQRARVERASRVAEGKPIKTDPVVHARILDLARDKPDEFKALRLETLVASVSGSDLEQIARLQRDMSKPETEREVATVTQVIGTYTGGFRPERKDAFSRAFLDEVNRFTRENKRAPRYEDLTKIGDRLMIDGEVLSGSIFRNDPNMRYFEATPEQRARFAPTISSAERRQVTEALVAEGIAKPTEAQIIARFKFAKGMR